MVDLLRVGHVQYVWNEETGDRLPLCYLYFCKYCLDIRSAENLLHEVDSHYCPQNLDGVSTTEAASRKNKSLSYWQCPICPSLLFTKTESINHLDPDDTSKETVKKTYYLVCSFCRWSNRDAGLEDKDSTAGGWTEKEIPNLDKISNVINYYKQVAQKEVSDTKNAKRRYRSFAMQLQQKFGRKPHPASPLNAIASRHKEYPETKQVDIPLTTFSIEDIEPVPEEMYHKKVDFTKLCSISQRLRQPEHQTAMTKDVLPQKATMFVKRSLRCKECQHNLIKPEYHPTSIKFKMQLVAIHYVPEIRIHRAPILKPGERTRVTLVVINRTDHPSHITLSRIHQENLSYPAAKSSCELPSKDLVISRFEDTEFGISDEHDKMKDNASEIAFRNSNEVGFYVWVTPSQELKEGEDVWISFNMKYDYRSNFAILLQSSNADKKTTEPEVNWLCHRIFINLGRLRKME